MHELQALGDTALNPFGIFLVELNLPIENHPIYGIAYDLSGLTAKDVEGWIITERSNIERGWSAGTPTVRRALPSWENVLAGLPDLIRGAVAVVVVSTSVAEARAEPICP